ncbi:MMPL family transporter [Candidatus Woesearchaeota archaeon]|nr:MMPL family transporter [Candidatus Woesearchaeota archaeon]
MSKAKKIITHWRVIIALAAIVLALVAIHPNPFVKGVTIRAVTFNSSVSSAGITSTKPTSSPMSRERIISMNNIPIENLEDYYDFISTLKANRTVHIKTNKNLYKLITKPGLNDDEIEDIGLSVYEAPTTNIRKGLDLQGGTRVLLQPEENLEPDAMEILLSNMQYRLNVYGLSDVVVRESGDLSGNQYVLVEIAGAKEEEVKELLAKQGKFEATIANETVFKGGQDITYVCRSADCAGIDPMSGCGKSGDLWVCRFRFAISLSPEAAERQAEITKDLPVITENSEEYLSEKLILYLDDAPVDELFVGSDLKGRAVTDIQISGSGAGSTQQEAVFNSLENMKKLQTVLITGSLPVKLDIVKTDTISPIFGKEFIKNALFIGLLAVISVIIVILVRYRKIKVAAPMLFTIITELVILLGVAAIIGWNLDLAAIAGIIVAIGTGVDHQIVIADETLKGESSGASYDWKQKIKRAFFIIMAAYFTTVVAMLPLMKAGAGLLRGFAVTTIIGVSVGVLITRPAYASIVEILLKE